MPWPEPVPLGSPQPGKQVLLSLMLTTDSVLHTVTCGRWLHVWSQDDPSLRVSSLSIWKCLEARKAQWVGVLTGRSVSVLVLGRLFLLLSGDNGAPDLAGLVLLSNSATTLGSGAKWTSLLEVCIHCVQFSCLINPPSWSGSHPKYGSELNMEKDLLCVEFALERNWNFRFYKVWGFPHPFTA